MLEKNHWIVQSKLLKAAFNLGYSFNSLRAILLEPGMTINNLPPPPPLQPGDNIPVGIGLRPKVDLGSDLPEFSLSVLQECLVEFIVAHDEVCDAFRSGPVLLMSVPLSGDQHHRIPRISPTSSRSPQGYSRYRPPASHQDARAHHRILAKVFR